jgi:sugar O-acyltransferase (sialic acid O-acetyltransferase NeuD family)
MPYKMKKLIIIGTGGHAKVVFSIAHKLGYEVIGFFDDINIDKKTFMDRMVIHKWEELFDQYAGNIKIVVAVGNNFNRQKLVEKIQINSNFSFVSLIDPETIISHDVQIGKGSVIMPGSIINIGTQIGDHCIINTGAQLDHGCFMDNFSSLGPGSICGGDVHIGRYSAVCLGAKVIEKVVVGHNSILGANSLLLKNLESNSLAYGSPAKVVESEINDRNYLK